MTTFIGDYHCKLDAKGRVVVPSAFKRQIDPASGERFVVKKDVFEKCLVLYPMDEWERQVKMIRSRINPYNREHSKFLRGFYMDTAELEMDSNNRVLLPKRLLDEAGIGADLVLAGQDGRIEVWAKEIYGSIRMDENEFADLAQRILGGTSLNDQQP